MADLNTLGLEARYTVEGELGRGAASLVLGVVDRFFEVRCALKLSLRSGRVRRYREEFRRLLELRHPNIVRAFDMGSTRSGLPYYTLELVEGSHLSSFPERAEPQALALIAMQMLDALATLHARGWVHRDIKPKNILVAGHGTAALARLIDLGLVSPAGSAPSAAGTLPYVAPETARGETIDGRADLYSLGMTLYEALLPDTMARTVEDVARLLSERPPAPARINPTIPSGLSDFIMRLIAVDPNQRFPDAHTAMEALARLPGLAIERGPARAAAERLLRGGAVSHRARAIAKVRRWTAAGRESPDRRALVIEGPVGVGKTPFVREVGMLLNLEGYRVLRLRCTSEPGAPLAALTAIAHAIAPNTFTQVTPNTPATEAPVAVALARHAGQVGVALANSLGREATAVVIDDLHRAEPMVIQALRSMSSAATLAPLLLLCAGDPRPDEMSLADALGGPVEKVHLAPLTKREIAALAAHRLCGLQIPAPALERLVTDSQGMPALVERTLARLVVEGTIRREGSRFVFAGGRYRAAAYADRELTAARIRQVRDTHKQVLWAAAVLAHEINAQDVARVAATSLEQAAATLAELARLEILSPAQAKSDPVYGFAARSLLAAIYQQIPEAQRRSFHDRAADVLAQGRRSGGRTEERVEHLLKGSDQEGAVSAAIAAGERAAAVYADRRAIEYYARAYARLKGTRDARAGSIALRLGKLFERTGELERAAVWFQAAIDAQGGAAIDAEANLGLGGMALVRGHISLCQRYAQRAMELTLRAPELRLHAMARRLEALAAMQGGDQEAAEDLLARALAELKAAGAEAEAVETLLDLARIAKRRGQIVRAVRYARQGQRLARTRGDPAALAEASTVLSRGFMSAARFRAARRALFMGLRVARASGDRLRQALVLREAGNLSVREGELANALERYERSLELTRALHAKSDESACLHNIGLAHTQLGQFRAALTALKAAVSIAEATGDVQGSAYSLAELGHTLALLGDLAQASASLVRARELAATLKEQVVLAEASALLAWVDLRRGQDTTWRHLLGTLKELVAPLEDPANHALTLLFAARCAVLAGDTPQALALSEQAAEVVGRGALADFAAMAMGVHGQALALAGDEAHGTTQVLAAAALAGQRHMRPLEAELRAWVGRRAAGTDLAVEELTLAMELTREVALALAEDQRRIYLGTAETLGLRTAFQAEATRVLGAAAPPTSGIKAPSPATGSS